MHMKLFLTIILISTIFFSEVPRAITLESNVYSQGIYDITNLPQVKAKASLVSQNDTVSLMIINPNGNEIFYKKFDTLNEVIDLGTILDNDRIVIVGSGQIAITISS